MGISQLRIKEKDLLLTEMIRMRIFRTISIGLLLLLGSRCTYKLEGATAPKDLIPKDTFTMVLHDIMIVEAYYKMNNPEVRSFYKTLPPAMDSIFNKYNVDSLRYAESMDYYSSEQKELLEIYNSIQDSLILNTAKFEHN